MTLSIDITHQLPDLPIRARFEVPAGVTALFGPSGSGKTSVINAVAGLLQPDAGRIAIGDTPLFDHSAGLSVPIHKRAIGYVFQEGRLFPHLTVRQNLRYGRWFAGLRGGSAEEDHLVALLGLAPLLDRQPVSLSGGEKQRVAIGRALLRQPQILLMDEPLAALDLRRKSEILPYLERLRDEIRIPILYVSHDISEIARLADQIAVIHAGQVQRCAPAGEVLSDPALAHVIGPQDAGALLTGQVIAHHDDGLSEIRAGGGTMFLPKVPQDTGATIRVRINAKDVMISLDPPHGISALNTLRCRIEDIRPGRGPGAILRLSAGSDTVLARITKRSVAALDLSLGQTCYAVIKTVSVNRADVGGPQTDIGDAQM